MQLLTKISCPSPPFIFTIKVLVQKDFIAMILDVSYISFNEVFYYHVGNQIRTGVVGIVA